MAHVPFRLEVIPSPLDPSREMVLVLGLGPTQLQFQSSWDALQTMARALKEAEAGRPVIHLAAPTGRPTVFDQNKSIQVIAHPGNPSVDAVLVLRVSMHDPDMLGTYQLQLPWDSIGKMRQAFEGAYERRPPAALSS